MNILLAANNKYISGLKTLLYSLYKTQSEKINIYMFNDHDLSAFTVLLSVETLCKKYNFNFNVIDLPKYVCEDLFILDEQLKGRTYYSKENYYRLLIPFFPDNVDRFLWLDADNLVLKDLSDFYNSDFKDKFLIGTSSHWIDKSNINTCDFDFLFKKDLNFRGYDFWIKGSIILFNVDKIKKDYRFKKETISKLCIKSLSFGQMDSDLLAILFFGDILFESNKKYNLDIMIGIEHYEEIDPDWAQELLSLRGEKDFNKIILEYKNNIKLISEASVIHYTAKYKPWYEEIRKCVSENEPEGLWYKFEKESQNIY